MAWYRVNGGGGTDTSDATLNNSNQMLSGVTAYSKDVKYTGTIPSKSKSDITIENNTATIPIGNYAASVTVSATELVNGTASITDTSVTDVTNYANAQVNDSNLTSANIKSGSSILGVSGTFTSDATAAASDILSGKTAYVNGSIITGNIASKSSSDLIASAATVTAPAGYYSSSASKTINIGALNTPTISSSGLITSSVGTSGYIADSWSKTLQLTTQGAATITPGIDDQVAVRGGRYTTGVITVAGDSNLVASNIKSGVSIFGVSGSLTSGYKFAEITNIYKSGSYIYLICTVPTTATVHAIVGTWWVDGVFTFTSTMVYNFNALTFTISSLSSNQMDLYCTDSDEGLVTYGSRSITNDGTELLIPASSITFNENPTFIDGQRYGVYYTE